MRKTVPRKRAGWTLVELMVVIALMTLLLSTSAILLTSLFRSQQSLANGLENQSIRARLGVQLRSDAHGATSAKCDSPQSCDFVLPSGEIVHYEMIEAALHRELRKADAVTQRETYPLAHGQATFSLDESRELPLVRLSIQDEPEPRKYASASRSSLLEAAVGTLPPKSGRRAAP